MNDLWRWPHLPLFSISITQIKEIEREERDRILYRLMSRDDDGKCVSECQNEWTHKWKGSYERIERHRIRWRHSWGLGTETMIIKSVHLSFGSLIFHGLEMKYDWRDDPLPDMNIKGTEEEEGKHGENVTEKRRIGSCNEVTIGLVWVEWMKGERERRSEWRSRQLIKSFERELQLSVKCTLYRREVSLMRYKLVAWFIQVYE